MVSYLYAYYRRKGEPFLASNNLAVSSDLFRRVGGFDERYPLAAGEDREFCRRYRQAGCALVHAPDGFDAFLYHLGRRRSLTEKDRKQRPGDVGSVTK